VVSAIALHAVSVIDPHMMNEIGPRGVSEIDPQTVNAIDHRETERCFLCSMGWTKSNKSPSASGQETERTPNHVPGSPDGLIDQDRLACSRDATVVGLQAGPDQIGFSVR
jgi:hypothetical protein